ncbi:MAG: ABC transporter ATP-binding protein [Burkholderiales bacterium]
MTEAVLATHMLTRYFGGLAANSEVSIELHRGLLHAVVGPNGAGKSTLINLLSGDLPASSGGIRYRGREISNLSADRRSRLGIGRSYQKTNIFARFSAFENCRLAAQSRAPQALRLFSSALDNRSICNAAYQALEQAGLSGRGGKTAAALSHGEQRQLEIAMVLATNPEVLLLDEPLAGMGAEESAAMVALLKKLSPQHAILLVEHDMDAVFAAADMITVMVNGQVLACGTPAQIRASPEVQQAYLGRTDE